MWHDEGAWIAVGVSALVVVVGLLMHRIFVRILKPVPLSPDRKENHE